MKFIKITKKQRNNLCNQLASIIFDLKQDKNIECIYFVPYTNLGKNHSNTLELTLIKNGFIEIEDEEIIKEYNRIYKSDYYLNNLGIKLYFSIDTSNYYKNIPFNLSEIRKVNKLFNSTILFDRTKEYIKLKKLIKEIGVNEGGIHYFKDLAEFIPPITNKINNLIKYKK